MHFLKLQDTELYPDQKVIKADQFKVFREGEAILAQATSEAQAIVEQAWEQAEQSIKQGYEEGLNRGKIEIAEKMLTTMEKASSYLKGIEHNMVDVVISSVHNIIGEFGGLDRVSYVVNQLLESAREQALVTLWVSKEDFESQRAGLKDLHQQFPGIVTIKIELNEQLQTGEAIMQTEIGMVESTLEAQLLALKNSLTAGITNPPAN